MSKQDEKTYSSQIRKGNVLRVKCQNPSSFCLYVVWIPQSETWILQSQKRVPRIAITHPGDRLPCLGKLKTFAPPAQ